MTEPTEWYYAFEGTSKGPVSQVQFDELIDAGVVRENTLVWQEGMDDWLPLGRLRSANTPPARAPYLPDDIPEDPARADANSFTGALKDGFARFVDFRTRSSRPQFWWWCVWSIIISVGAAILDGSLGMFDSQPIGSLSSLVMLLPSLAVGVRRLHDIGRTGWWVLIALVPLIGFFVLLFFFVQKSEDSANRWGPAPRG
ncbi:DUF805 domain-containing protein [Sulfitobacter sp. S190]|uniref:DUF805 domain-containing protein n=1 Tax=Sulfitobacter sp. S190 TaxID=2867022 RepID=UPI0021A91D25|nr:DUF805 domain-containing protein [Sulfitobacter sp. S190]UWR22678.1 DUF805 domain-containing protein [Sulfitobacter sp. S190]